MKKLVLAGVFYSPEQGYKKQYYNPETNEFFNPESTTETFFKKVWKNNPDKQTSIDKIKLVTLW